MAKKEEEKPKEKERYDVVSVPTQTTPMIADTIEDDPEKRYLTIEQALVLVLNKLENMEEKIVG